MAVASEVTMKQRQRLMGVRSKFLRQPFEEMPQMEREAGCRREASGEAEKKPYNQQNGDEPPKLKERCEGVME